MSHNCAPTATEHSSASFSSTNTSGKCIPICFNFDRFQHLLTVISKFGVNATSYKKAIFLKISNPFLWDSRKFGFFFWRLHMFYVWEYQQTCYYTYLKQSLRKTLKEDFLQLIDSAFTNGNHSLVRLTETPFQDYLGSRLKTHWVSNIPFFLLRKRNSE